jgi:peroxiredoxin Q/BCP
MPVQVGDQAPDFTATASDGREVSLAQFRGRQAVVLFFYPKDDSLVCTQQACAFRDSYEDFIQLGAAVIGVSSDSDESHRSFAASQKLPYFLISDAGGRLRKLYEVPKLLFVVPGRVTYVIDQQGVIRHIFNSMFRAERHVEQAKEALQRLDGSGDLDQRP